MTFEAWFLLIGTLLLLMAFAYPFVQRLPMTTAIVYLLIGVALGGQELLYVNPLLHAPWLHRATEIAVVVSLFTVGLKLRLPLRDRRLWPAFCLAFVSMILTVGLVAVAGVALLGLSLGAAILLGGVLAPTDPVLASDVQVKDPNDQDKLRLTLSAEAGLNDGTAFPFVMLGLGLLNLHDLGGHAWRWWAVDVVWAVVGGLAIGGGLGYGLGRLALRLVSRQPRSVLVGEYFVLGLIGASYGAAVYLQAYGFLAVFAAGVALRAVERTATSPEPVIARPPAAAAVGVPASVATGSVPMEPAYFAGALLATNEQLERMLEVGLVLLVGAALMVAGISTTALWFAPLLFLVIRPIAALPVRFCGKFTGFEFGAIAWFGIRGIGSIYYAMYAIEKGLPADTAHKLVSLTLTIVALSVLVHGISVTPLLNYYQRNLPFSRGAKRRRN
ncbi:MAG: cation:proton antiporter [Opitutaceae bacterium]|nr:cation:proton antiporter [Opitutaceae bacterium]